MQLLRSRVTFGIMVAIALAGSTTQAGFAGVALSGTLP